MYKITIHLDLVDKEPIEKYAILLYGTSPVSIKNPSEGSLIIAKEVECVLIYNEDDGVRSAIAANLVKIC